MSSSTPPPPPEVTTEPTASDQEIARLRERVKELEARLAPPEPRAATNDQPQFSSIVLFGADGNLATKKTFPTLFALWRKKLLPRDIVIVGYAREAMDTETFRKNIVRSRRPTAIVPPVLALRFSGTPPDSVSRLPPQTIEHSACRVLG